MFSPNAQDRCDRCGAQAYHRAEHVAGELLLCNHHHREFQDSLLAQGWVIESVQQQAEPVPVG